MYLSGENGGVNTLVSNSQTSAYRLADQFSVSITAILLRSSTIPLANFKADIVFPEPLGQNNHNFSLTCLRSALLKAILYIGNYISGIVFESILCLTAIIFNITNTNRHYHVPLLLSRFGYSTYRGS